MVVNVRHKMQHVGDYFVSAICDVINSAKGCAKGVFLTYDINELKREKKSFTKKIGQRLVQLKKDVPSLHVPDDEKLAKLFARMDEIQNKIDANIKERGV